VEIEARLVGDERAVSGSEQDGSKVDDVKQDGPAIRSILGHEAPFGVVTDLVLAGVAVK
jgi:hypothetical protein